MARVPGCDITSGNQYIREMQTLQREMYHDYGLVIFAYRQRSGRETDKGTKSAAKEAQSADEIRIKRNKAINQVTTEPNDHSLGRIRLGLRWTNFRMLTRI